MGALVKPLAEVSAAPFSSYALGRIFVGRFVRIPFVQQMEAVECGAACLTMLLRAFGHHADLSEVRRACGVSRDGVSAKSVVRVARDYGLNVKAKRLEPEQLAELDEPVMARALLDRLHRDLRVGSGEWVERSIAEIAVTAAEGDLDDAKARWRELSKHPLCPVDRHWRIDLFLAKLDPGGGFDRDRILSDAYRLGRGEVALRLWPEIVQADPAPQAPVRIHVLGDLRVTVNGDPVRIPEGHVRDVVSLLMVSNRSANLETVLDRLWPDAGLDDAKRRFKNVMRRMRDLLGDAAVARESNKVFFTDQVSSDLEDFEAAWASALGTQRSDPAAAARAAVTALELYSGPLLSDDPFDERVGRLRVALSDQAEDLLSIVRSSPDSQQRSPAWIAAAEQRVYREV